MMLGDVSRAGCGGGLPRTAHFAKWNLHCAISTPGPSDIPTMGMSTMTAYVLFMFEDTSRVGCGPGLPRIAHSQKWDLESANTQCRVHGPRIRYYRRTV
jgi:hypothetical protein